jgi:hypothetical protein
MNDGCGGDDRSTSNHPFGGSNVTDVRIDEEEVYHEIDFEQIRPYGTERDGKSLYKIRVKWSQLFLDWVINEDIPRDAAMRFVKTMKRELRYMDFDVQTMKNTWRGCTNLYPKKLAKLGPIKKVVEGTTVKSEYMYLGLEKQIRSRKECVLYSSYKYPEEHHPRVPHFLIELWIDGVDLAKSGRMTNLWPVDCCIVAVGESHTAQHRHVPAYAAQPFSVAMHLSEGKPENATVLLGDVVKELLKLDPREEENAEYIRRAGFSVSLYQFAGDLLAQVLAKSVKGHTSARPCFKCRVFGRRYKENEKGPKGIQIIEIKELILREDRLFLKYDQHAHPVSFTTNIASLSLS